MNTEELQASYGQWQGADWQPRNSYDRVKEFHETFGHPVSQYPVEIDNGRVNLRASLIMEEVIELLEALGYMTDDLGSAWDAAYRYTDDVNIVAVADALGDIEYVVNGAALEFGIPLPEVVAEIHDSNMSKLDVDGKPIYRSDGKVMKGPNYREPDLEKVLFNS